MRSLGECFLDFLIPFVPDSRYPTLFVGGRVTKFPLYGEPPMAGKVVKYDFGAGCPWVVEWDREVRFECRSSGGPRVSRTHVHLGEELRHEHACIVCEHGGHQVDQTCECVCGYRMEAKETP